MSARIALGHTQGSASQARARFRGEDQVEAYFNRSRETGERSRSFELLVQIGERPTRGEPKDCVFDSPEFARVGSFWQVPIDMAR